MVATDWILLGIILVSSVFGLMRGFVGVVVSLIAWLLSGWAALRFGGDVGAMLAGADAPTTAEVLAGYALSFLGVLLLVSLVGWLVRWAMKSAGLSGVDRVLGLVLGVVRGGFVACALVLLFGLTSMPGEPEWQASPVVPVLVPGARVLRAWLPDWVAEQVYFGSFDDRAPADSAPTALPAPVGPGPGLP